MTLECDGEKSIARNRSLIDQRVKRVELIVGHVANHSVQRERERERESGPIRLLYVCLIICDILLR